MNHFVYKPVARTVPRVGKIAAVHRVLTTQDVDGEAIKENLFLRFGINPGSTYITQKDITRDTTQEWDVVYEDFEYGIYKGMEIVHTGDYIAITDSEGNYEIYDAPAGNYTLTASRYGYDTVTQSGFTIGVSTVQNVALNCQTLLKGTVSDFIYGYTIEDATVTVNDGAVRFEDCARFDFTWEESDPQNGKYLGISSIWLAPNVGIVKQTHVVVEYGEVTDSGGSNLIDYNLIGNGAHQYLPLQEAATWNYIEKRKYSYWGDYQYTTYTVSCHPGLGGEGYWGLNVGEFHINGDYIYISPIDDLYSFLFRGMYVGKIAPRALAKVGKAAAVQRALSTHNGVYEYQMFRFNRSPGYRWTIYSEMDGDYTLTVTGKYVGSKTVNIADSRTMTDIDGHYSFLGIPPGSDYTVTASEYAYAPSTEKSVTVSEGTTINFTLMPMSYYRTIVNVAEAASMGIINQYCYVWDTIEGSGQYVPISATDDTLIAPWTGFWVAAYYPMALFFP